MILLLPTIPCQQALLLIPFLLTIECRRGCISANAGMFSFVGLWIVGFHNSFADEQIFFAVVETLT